MMNRLLALLAAGLISSAVPVFVLAAQPAPEGQTPTGVCKDGSNYFGASKKGACHGHGGVKEWMGAAAAPAAVAGGAAAAAPAASHAAAPTAAPAPAQAPAAMSKSASSAQPAAMAAAGGGPGKVWVNEESKVYHCSGDKWYGRTKHGEYMSEAQAKSQGFHADHGKACTS